MAIYMPMGYLQRRSCAVCGKKFKPTSRTDKYCSIECMRRRHDGPRLDFEAEIAPIVTTEALKEMSYEERVGLRLMCSNARCGRVFTIGDREDGRRDRRTRFCCADCERQFWRDATRHPLKTGSEARHERRTGEA